MLVLLPPSETKAAGGAGPALDTSSMWLPELTEVRESLVSALVDLSADPAASRTALGLGEGREEEVERNRGLRTAPTCPALARYTGVLYDALDARSFTKAQRARADRRLAIGSALFGVVSATDLVPAYRLSAGSALPGMPTLRAMWKPVLSAAVESAADGLIVDLRSGAYQQLGPVEGAVSATVLTEKPDGTRTVVSHFNKHHKGVLARALATTRAEPRDARAVAAVARKAGLRVEVASSTDVVVLTD